MCSFNGDSYDMSDVEETNFDIISSLAINTTDTPNLKSCCKKCTREEAQVCLRNKNKYCKSCFLNILVHKFRATLGKSKSIRQHDSILIAHSGKANSTVLLNIVAADSNESNNKKPCSRYKVVYIDDGTAKGYTVEEREMLQNAFAEEAKRFKLPTYVISLTKSMADITSDDLHSIDKLQSCVSNEDTMLHEIFQNLETDTARHDLLHQLRQKLLFIVARKLNCNKMFVADTSVDLATKVLGDISTGRGSQLPFNVAFSDIRHKDVTLLRPLRDFTADDIVGYMNCCKLNPILNSEKYDSFFPSSIQNITKNFVHELESQFYGTVSTIYRTSEKLTKRTDDLTFSVISRDANAHNPCIICDLPVDLASLPKQQLSVAQAKLFSELVSTDNDYTSDVYSLNVCKTLSDKRAETSHNFLERQTSDCIEMHLCYSCRLIFFNSKQMNNIIPSFIVNALERKFHIARMREEVVDFLL